MRLCPPFHKNADTRPPNATIDATMAVNWWALFGYFNSAAINESTPAQNFANFLYAVLAVAAISAK